MIKDPVNGHNGLLVHFLSAPGKASDGELKDWSLVIRWYNVM